VSQFSTALHPVTFFGHPLLPFMFKEWLPSYREIGGIAAVLSRLSHFRIKRTNSLREGAEELSRNYEELPGVFP
jgi:acyl carrier protein phosphodiesterase